MQLRKPATAILALALSAGLAQVLIWSFLVIDLLLRNSSQECRAHSVMLCCRCDQYERYQPLGVKIL